MRHGWPIKPNTLYKVIYDYRGKVITDFLENSAVPQLDNST